MTPGAWSLLVDLEVWLHALAADLATATGADRPVVPDGRN